MSTTATRPPEVVSARARARRTPGEIGVWVFVLGDMATFAAFFAVIIANTAQHHGVVRASQEHLSRGSGALNTVLLLTSSVLVAFAVRAARVPGQASHDRSSRLLGFALLCAAAFVLVKVLEYRAVLHAGFHPNSNTYYAYFFVFTGIHLMHVTAGMVVLGWLRRLVRRPEPSARDTMLVESGASYWHMVDLLWIVLFPLLYLVS